MLFPLFYVSQTQAVVINMNVLASTITVGQAFDVTVTADGQGIGQDLLAFGFDVNATSPNFSYNSYALGNGFSDFSDPFNPNNVAGVAFPGISTNNVLLATLSFTADSEGTSNLSINGLYDGFFTGLFYAIDGYDAYAETAITVSPGGAKQFPVPEPETLLLLGVGVCLAVLVTRKREMFRG